MITLENFKAELETWDNLKAYLESLPTEQIGGASGSREYNPMALYLRLKYQDVADVNALLCAMSEHELLTPIWLRKYLEFFARNDQEYFTAEVCLTLLNRIIEEMTPPPPEETTTEILD